MGDTKVRPHGTRAKYTIEKCHCLRCSAANTNYETNRTKQKAFGRWQSLVDAAPTRAHVQQLQAAGLGFKRIAALAGVSVNALALLLYGARHRGRGPSKRIRPDTAEKLLAVTAGLEALGSSTIVDAVGVRRRLQALVAMGWSQASLAARLGMTPSNFNVWLSTDTVTAATAIAVRRLYDELWDEPPLEDTPGQRGSVSRARRYAFERGWLPPMAWDDDEIDIPDKAVRS